MSLNIDLNMSPLFKWAILITMLANLITGLAHLQHKRQLIKAARIIEGADCDRYNPNRAY